MNLIRSIWLFEVLIFKIFEYTEMREWERVYLEIIFDGIGCRLSWWIRCRSRCGRHSLILIDNTRSRLLARVICLSLSLFLFLSEYLPPSLFLAGKTSRGKYVKYLGCGQTVDIYVLVSPWVKICFLLGLVDGHWEWDCNFKRPNPGKGQSLVQLKS